MSDPLYEVTATGANWTVAVHVADAVNVAPQVVDESVKPVPVTESDTLSVPVPLFCNVKIFVGVEPICTFPNAKVEGVQEIAGKTPVPERAALPEIELGVSVSVSEPLYELPATGANCTVAVQVAEAARVAPQVVEFSVNAVPVTDNETFNVAVPVFCSVKLCVAVLPAFTLPKLKLLGLQEIAGALPAFVSG